MYTFQNVHSDRRDNVHDFGCPNPAINPISAEKGKQLQKLKEKLTQWEKSLEEREALTKNFENEIFREKMGMLDLKSNILDERDKVHQQAMSNAETVVEMRLLQNELKHKEERIQQLDKELATIKSKSRISASTEQRQKEEPKPFWEVIKGYLPWIISSLALVATYLIAKNGEKPTLPSELKALKGVFDGLSEKDQKSLGEKLKHYANLHVGQADKDGTLHLKGNQLLKK